LCCLVCLFGLVQIGFLGASIFGFSGLGIFLFLVNGGFHFIAFLKIVTHS